MKLVINGTLQTDPFGIPFLKHTAPVNKVIDLSQIQSGYSIGLLSNELTLGVSLTEGADGTLDAEIKAAVLGMPIFDRLLPLDSHVANGPVPLRAGGPQFGFSGTLQVTA